MEQKILERESIDIPFAQVCKWDKDSYVIIDIRDEISFGYGNIPNSIQMDYQIIQKDFLKLPPEKKLVIVCKSGVLSKEVALTLREAGLMAFNLAGGYHSWLLEEMSKKENRIKEIEQSLNKKFHKAIFSRFTKAINRYELIQERDKIAVCISGGKDSMLMAKLFQELQRHKRCNFELIFLVMDPGYNEFNRKIIEDNMKLLGIPAQIFETNIFDAVFEIENSPCYLCARMRRGHLYSKAKELGCNKIALGHHYDDVIETILMGMLYGSQIQTMMPKLHSTNFEGMELIRPMYLIREQDIKHWRDYNNLHFIQCACRFTNTCSTTGNNETKSKRQEIKQLIAKLKEVNPAVEGNIFSSVENVNLDTIIEYKHNGVRHSFLEKY